MHRDLVRHDDEEAARAASWVGCTFTNTFLNVENPAPGPAAFFLTKEVDAGKLGLPASCTPSSPRGLPAVWRLCSRRRNVVKVCQAVSSHLFSTKYQVFRFWKSRSVAAMSLHSPDSPSWCENRRSATSLPRTICRGMSQFLMLTNIFGKVKCLEKWIFSEMMRPTWLNCSSCLVCFGLNSLV